MVDPRRASKMERIGYNGYKEHVREPQYKHDSECCNYLGRYKAPYPRHDDGVADYDLYYCSQGARPTVILRYGNEGWEYDSGMNLATGYRAYSTHPLIVAARVARSRAIQAGLFLI